MDRADVAKRILIFGVPLVVCNLLTYCYHMRCYDTYRKGTFSRCVNDVPTLASTLQSTSPQEWCTKKYTGHLINASAGDAFTDRPTVQS